MIYMVSTIQFVRRNFVMNYVINTQGDTLVYILDLNPLYDKSIYTEYKYRIGLCHDQ